MFFGLSWARGSHYGSLCKQVDCIYGIPSRDCMVLKNSRVVTCSGCLWERQGWQMEVNVGLFVADMMTGWHAIRSVGSEVEG